MFAAACTPARSFSAALPAVNLYENDKEVLLELELPGLGKDEVSLEFEENILVISARPKSLEREGYRRLYRERPLGGFERRFRVGEDLDAGKVQARFDNGLLIVSIQKQERAQPRKVEIL